MRKLIMVMIIGMFMLSSLAGHSLAEGQPLRRGNMSGA